MMAVDCTYGTCRNRATHRVSLEIRSGRGAGESVVLWVCERHSKEAAATGKKGIVERVRSIATT